MLELPSSFPLSFLLPPVPLSLSHMQFKGAVNHLFSQGSSTVPPISFSCLLPAVFTPNLWHPAVLLLPLLQ